MNPTDLKEREKIAKLRTIFARIEKHIQTNLDYQGHIQINFFSGFASNWTIVQIFQEKTGKNNE